MGSVKTFVGLSCTGHDGAVALVENRALAFAEAAERYRQSKFAVGMAPDDHHYCRNVLAQHASGDEIVLARSWSAQADAIWHAENDLLRQSIAALPQHRDVLQQLVTFHRDSWDHFMKPSIDIAGHGLHRAAGALGRRVVETRAYDHHLCHAAFGAWSSPFERAAVMVMDGQGEGRGTAFWHYRDGDLHAMETEPYGGALVACYGSLGLYYGILVCLACGFEPVAGEEWKIMGLAPYGRTDEALYRRLQALYTVDGLSVNCTDQAVDIFLELAGNPVSHKRDFQKAADYAHTFQRYFADISTALIRELARRTGEKALVLAGGCGLNSSFNGRIAGLGAFDQLFVPCAPADDGNAAGAAMLAARDHGEGVIAGGDAHTPYLGSSIDLHALEAIRRHAPFLPWARFDDEAVLVAEAARRIAAGQVVGWMQGRAEFGPRALGNRSILADPRRAEMKDRVNAVVKFREAFRPFAPSVLHEAGPDYFSDYQDSPYMERTLTFRPEMGARVPAVCHADGTGRAQSVTRARNPLYHRLIEAFAARTGVPMLLNTSLNVMGKPIVHSIEDGVQTFLGTGIDCLFVGPYLLAKDLATRPEGASAPASQLAGELA